MAGNRGQVVLGMQQRTNITSPQTSGTPLSTNHNHLYQGRPIPERPYSVAGQYPSPERRSYQDYSGYLSSPERRLPQGDGGPSGRLSFPPGYPPTSYDDMYGAYGSRSGSVTPVIDEEARIRVEYMEKQLASLTGLVQKALTTPSSTTRTGPTGADQKGIQERVMLLNFVEHIPAYNIITLKKYLKYFYIKILLL